MRIGELAAAAGVTTKAIRFYERVGLLAAPERTPGGYRDYDGEAVSRLSFIRAGQSAGLTLGELREVVALRDRGEVPCSHVVGLLETKALEIDRRITELGSLRREIEVLRRRASRLDPQACHPSKVCHIIASPE